MKILFVLILFGTREYGDGAVRVGVYEKYSACVAQAVKLKKEDWAFIDRAYCIPVNAP